MQHAHYLKCWPETAEQAHDQSPGAPVMRGDVAFALYGAIRARVNELGLRWENKIPRQSLYYLRKAAQIL